MRGKNKSQSLSPLVSFSLSLQYNVTKTHKTCRKIIVLLFVCAGGIVVYSLCTIVSICLICYYWECAECRCSVYLWSLEIGLYVWVSGWSGGAAGAPLVLIRQTYCYYYQCTYCFCVESNDESSGEMTVNWELLVMILVCRCVRLLQSYWCGWLVDWW